MRAERAILIAVGALVAAARAEASDPGVCARCHDTEAALAVDAGGHAPTIDCVTCHEERRPGVFGPRHRAIPTSCTGHHSMPIETHPPPRRNLAPARLRARCLKCHDPH